ncbi:MAG TPA: hypothetical protein VE646_08215 [Actinomycetota bacterium]|nr:hypothetical protein [Actinomycetota bacterium]
MQQPDHPISPEGSDRARRRGLFSRNPPAEDPLDPRLERAVATYQELVTERLEQGLQAIRKEASTLMHEVAAEVWRSAGGDRERIQATILESLARDQAIRGLVAHSDERFQDLVVRTARLEDAVGILTEQARAAQRAMTEGVSALEEAAHSPLLGQTAEVRTQLERVARQVAGAFEALAERDRALIETIQHQVREHGELVTRETGHIADSMQAYVQQGVSAMGQLAARVEDQLAAAPAAMEDTVRLLGEQLEMLDERVGIRARDLDGAVHVVEGRFEERLMGLARLIRSDSEALRQEMVRSAAQHDEVLAEKLDQELGRVSEALTAATRWTVEEMTRRLTDAHGGMIRQQLDEAVSAIDRNMVRMADTLDGGLERLHQRVGHEAAEAADRAIGGRMDSALDRLDAAARTVDRTGADLVKGQHDLEERLGQNLDARIAGLAKMVRSDNRALADRVQIAAEQEASKQTLRAVKEMQASLPVEVMEIVERRVQDIADQLHRDMRSTAESVARVGELLERKVDEMASRIGRRYDNDIQVVVERMGDAMHALAELGRPQQHERIELE